MLGRVDELAARLGLGAVQRCYVVEVTARAGDNCLVLATKARHFLHVTDYFARSLVTRGGDILLGPAAIEARVDDHFFGW